MIRHIVLVKFRSDIESDLKASIFSQLDQLRTQINGIIDFHSGANVSVELPLVRGFNDLFWFDFVDAASRDEYLVHPAHVAAGKRLVEHLEGGRDGIIVADIELD